MDTFSCSQQSFAVVFSLKAVPSCLAMLPIWEEGFIFSYSGEERRKGLIQESPSVMDTSLSPDWVSSQELHNTFVHSPVPRGDIFLPRGPFFPGQFEKGSHLRICSGELDVVGDEFGKSEGHLSLVILCEPVFARSAFCCTSASFAGCAKTRDPPPDQWNMKAL